MRFYRITISSWTASFRYPNLISGYQITLPVPPVSTVLGLIDAAAGNYIDFGKVSIGYYFEYDGKGTDLETIYQFSVDDHGAPKNNVKSNVLTREFLAGCRLYLYLSDEQLVRYFRHPVFQLLLGRSNDLASVDEIREVELSEVEHADHIRGQLIPFQGNFLPGVIQALPKYFTNTIPRENIGTEAYTAIPYSSKAFPTHLKAYEDEIDGEQVDIYIHHLDFE